MKNIKKDQELANEIDNLLKGVQEMIDKHGVQSIGTYKENLLLNETYEKH